MADPTAMPRPHVGDALLVATTNPGKTREIRSLLHDLPLRIVTLADLPPIPEPEENGRTFAENAAIKATAYARASGLATVAEDSGLVIDALGGRPGVESARYPGKHYPERFENLYRELARFAPPWPARFVCSLAFVPKTSDGLPDVTFAVEATVEGRIAPAAKGTHGFGYDPIFFYPPYGRTLGEVEGEEKSAVSHRGKAFGAFREWLEEGLRIEA